ncbi:MFS transporter [Psychrobium sp. MM17-31]|uniref:MFS transporter n=1 Tax=Psychrobium sp. MM17-31 TaxID=2917758 RepID=UPI001EF6E082|nr:MFS transporter [Psychrobium sp. MM17-31]MCG7531366.1 MFS transporter [Psychrobium sp. MM17-31]
MNTQQYISPVHRFIIIFAIVFAGEIIFSLPFHIARFFRPTLLEVFELSNTQLGDIFGLYGIMAMIAYFPGGAIADRFSAKNLMTISLVATALGGFYLMQIPSVLGLTILFGYWGVTTILLFWAAMIKITRLWGGENTQGIAFGILDGGRGLVAAAMATVSVLILNYNLPSEAGLVSLADKQAALVYVIAFYTTLTLAAAALVYIMIPFTPATSSEHRSIKKTILDVIKQPSIISQALIVLSAYCAYKSIDYFGLYATQVLNMDDVASAQLVSNASFVRPLVAIGAGLLADRLQPSKLISIIFALAIAAYLSFIPLGESWLLQANIFITFVLVFAVRAVYFALLAESKISGAITGTAVGIISVVGYTPDIFFAPIAGRILDASPGTAGFNQLFIVMAAISVIGLVSSLFLSKTTCNGNSQ